jgi:hypothetical protein
MSGRTSLPHRLCRMYLQSSPPRRGYPAHRGSPQAVSLRLRDRRVVTHTNEGLKGIKQNDRRSPRGCWKPWSGFLLSPRTTSPLVLRHELSRPRSGGDYTQNMELQKRPGVLEA